MFLTLTLPSYGAARDGVPADPESYDYRRAALDALHFPKLVDRFWGTCAAAPVTKFNISRRLSLGAGWLRTCMPRSAVLSLGRRCAG